MNGDINSLRNLRYVLTDATFRFAERYALTRVGIYIELVAVRQHIEILRNRIISILNSKNIEFAHGKHIDKRKYVYGKH